MTQIISDRHIPNPNPGPEGAPKENDRFGAVSDDVVPPKPKTLLTSPLVSLP